MDIETGETKTEYQYSANTDGSPIVPEEGNPFLQWVSKNNPQITPPPEFSDLSEHHYQRERDLETNGLSNEPEDFASLNTWYLNPVYAEAEIEELSPMERLRNIRQNKLVDSLIHICCNTTTGCPYPEGYLKFADEHKICF
ncbi:unnamed protein product [Orchesella dallaii]|uniref:Uncharacterized protein n=1 Tax=Orchesella dallaii TaxID=48710 RepID=A0ABP1QDL7_9HEXA